MSWDSPDVTTVTQNISIMYNLSRISGQLLNHCTKTTIRMGNWVSRSPQIVNNGRAMHVTAGALGGGVLKDGEDPLTVSNKEWQKRLTDEQYYITREKGTERPFSGEYVHNKEKGTYHCVCCGALLFSSSTKYDSGSGWPSFYEAVLNDEGNPNVLRKPDMSHGMKRVEVTCRQCDAHLGHVFEDGPQPTNERFCINSASLKFEPSK